MPGRAGPGRFVSLTVSDSGSGMPRDLISRIFDPFFSTKQGRDNAGFGLAMVYAILENHHGWIDVESKVGKGTRFAMFFPVFHEENKSHELGLRDAEKNNRPGFKQVLFSPKFQTL